MPEIDVIVVGRGPAGLATAAVIARDGARVALVGPPPPAANDTRTAALFTGSMNLLQHIGTRALLEPDITPLKGIRIVDDGPGPLHAPEVTFEAREIGLPDFGANVPQMPLVDALTRVAAGCAGLSVIDAAVTGIDVAAGMARVKLDNGDAIAAPLVAAADGRNSFCRSAVGIAADAWDYPQVAITAQFEHSRDHRGLSTEFHRPSGPCTVVPMPGLRSSLVWVERPAAARRLGDMDDAGFARALEERLHGILGTIGDIGVRRQFPLGCLKARSLGQRRVALVGEAGHMLPPIGAQGLNLGISRCRGPGRSHIRGAVRGRGHRRRRASGQVRRRPPQRHRVAHRGRRPLQPLADRGILAGRPDPRRRDACHRRHRRPETPGHARRFRARRRPAPADACLTAPGGLLS